MVRKEWKVLLIEDDPMVQEVNKEFITTVKGFDVCAIAGNGEEGIKLIKEKQPDLVILDVYMPKKDGIKTLQEIRKQKLEVDVIVVSAAKDKETISLMLQNGAVDYILKPFKLERMRQALEKYKQYKQKIEANDTLSQEQLDAILNIPQQAVQELPKGLNHFTMNEVTAFLKQQTASLSAEEVAKALGIARVTARRYLDYLEKNGTIKLDVQYGGVGRPVNRYVFIG
ncbi:MULTISPECIES: two-component system response regulator DctR [unclassified Bacillus (in: firmicutes)]|uniref:two-component system response regulator DctR n=1 Tax=unclassified Bacillus (in: firmicutes) TaxID=185979 RepID=UPI0022815CC1|nr:two-component system response regulator DctR [Bacillus sp. S20C3]MCY8205410.1 two-component system response regulator DctR [Bacillus sp. N12A5]MCY8289326.1 two-component system response regulator DctR [Bacillus sp. N13C7]MCY8637813.1 two-component system response regulator DctR [Bacillus sp. S17B2]MCY8719585.1 two-component system response regulator DctR [Bacillus sp. S10C12M]MCY9145302.1 two-component system response regulator DctR [Bacillus sp. T9C1]